MAEPWRPSVFSHYDKPHELYRLYDDSGRLLYVGITSKTTRERLFQHRREKPWWMDVADVEIEYYDNKHAAVSAEYDAIELECPVFNQMRFTR